MDRAALILAVFAVLGSVRLWLAYRAGELRRHRSS
jgi:hypothetical protein